MIHSSNNNIDGVGFMLSNLKKHPIDEFMVLDCTKLATIDDGIELSDQLGEDGIIFVENDVFRNV